MRPGNTVEIRIIATVANQGSADELRQFFEQTIVPKIKELTVAGPEPPVARFIATVDE